MQPQANVCKTRHEIAVLHPGIDMEKPVEMTLVQSSCGFTESLEYYMDVESVVCGDSQCKIDIIRLYWDALGHYKCIELPENVNLEKAEGISFSQSDYKKLDSILSDRNSALKDVQKYEVTGSETSEGIDALSGATIALDTKAYVKGAVWTCYSLWHWANGNTTNVIRNLTGDSMTIEALLKYLKKEPLKHKIFALEQLIRLKHRNAKVTHTVLQLARAQNQKLRKLVLQYIEQLPEKQFFTSIDSILKLNHEPASIAALRTLFESEKVPPDTFLDSLSNRVSDWDSYQQIDLFLNIIEKKGADTQKINDNLAPMLQRSDFLIARRVFWFLSKKKLSPQNKTDLLIFYDENANKL